jgi:hypothetical protein
LRGGKWNNAAAIGQQNGQPNEYFERFFYFLRSKMFRLLRKITGNSINASVISKLHVLWATIVITRLGCQNNLAAPLD